MTYQEKISFLRRYREAVRQEDTILQEIEELRTQAARVTRALTGMPGGGDGQAIPRAVERLEEARQKLDAQVEQARARRSEIAAVIQQEADPLRRDILTRRYILGQRWERIAADSNRDLRWMLRLHRRAVEELTIESH